jgi:hypothetical protein
MRKLKCQVVHANGSKQVCLKVGDEARRLATAAGVQIPADYRG